MGYEPLPRTRRAEEVAALTEPLRSALWTEHRIAVLLPPGSPRIAPPPGYPEPEDDDEDEDGDQGGGAGRRGADAGGAPRTFGRAVPPGGGAASGGAVEGAGDGAESPSTSRELAEASPLSGEACSAHRLRSLTESNHCCVLGLV
jgi:hypothetical protein